VPPQEAAGLAFPIFEQVVFAPAKQVVWERLVDRLRVRQQAQPLRVRAARVLRPQASQAQMQTAPVEVAREA
jgi:hypothetical protein